MSGAPTRRVVRAAAIAAAAPLGATAWLALGPPTSPAIAVGLLVVATLVSIGAVVASHRAVVRPLQTLANLLGGLRRGDYSMRAAQAGPDDPLGIVLLETNALADTLRSQRLDALEAGALLRKVMAEIDVAVFAFDEDEVLRLVNRAGERLLGRPRERVEGSGADELGLRELLQGPAPRIVELAFPGAHGRGELRRGSFRQNGRPHVLLVLADLSRALRQEELAAWRRLVRVLSHEINNSLAPIASVAGGLRRGLARAERADDWERDLGDGLALVESRATALARFMKAYAKLARLPPPTLGPVDLGGLVRRVAALEYRCPVLVEGGPELEVEADADQLEQLLINLVGNAVDAVAERPGGVRLRWARTGRAVEVRVLDDGPGLASTANLFVPFFSTKPGGQGIGLALGRQIAESHGGTLQLRNRDDASGCEATVRLPMP